jgi:hypothetical protein
LTYFYLDFKKHTIINLGFKLKPNLIIQGTTMSYKQWKQDETKKKHADTLINMGEKFYYAAFMTPVAMLLKYDITYVLATAFISLLIFGIIGVLFQKEGLKIYDTLESV